MPDCFISYSRKDERFARAIHKDLERRGLNVFMAAISLRPGDRWSTVILKALSGSPWVIFLASNSACKSPYVQQEIGRALDGRKKLIPIVWDMPPSELPGWTNQIQALDIRGQTPAQIQSRIVSLARRIKAEKDQGLLIGAGLVAAFIWASGRKD